MVTIGTDTIPRKQFTCIVNYKLHRHMYMRLPAMDDLCWIKSAGINIEFCILKSSNEISSALEAFTSSVVITVRNTIVCK